MLYIQILLNYMMTSALALAHQIPYANKFICFLKLKNYDEGLKNLLISLDLHPNNIQYHFRKAIYSFKGNHSDAIRIIKPFSPRRIHIRAKNSPSFYNPRARVFEAHNWKTSLLWVFNVLAESYIASKSRTIWYKGKRALCYKRY